MLSTRRKDEFFKKLEGPLGCDFKEKVPGKVDSISWRCAGGNDKSLSIKILTEMGIQQKNIDQFLQDCHEHGGHCDCEIIFNAKERILKAARKQLDYCI